MKFLKCSKAKAIDIIEITITKFQFPNNHQLPNSNHQMKSNVKQEVYVLVIEDWNLLDYWCLVFGYLIRL